MAYGRDKSSYSEVRAVHPSRFDFSGICSHGKKRLEKLAEIQKQQLGIVQEINRHWIDRMQSEAKLASEFATKLTSARSMPEVAMAYQEWTSRHLDMATEDAKRIVADSQKLVETGARLLSNSWLTNGQGDGAQ